MHLIAHVWSGGTDIRNARVRQPHVVTVKGAGCRILTQARRLLWLAARVGALGQVVAKQTDQKKKKRKPHFHHFDQVLNQRGEKKLPNPGYLSFAHFLGQCQTNAWRGGSAQTQTHGCTHPQWGEGFRVWCAPPYSRKRSLLEAQDEIKRW